MNWLNNLLGNKNILTIIYIIIALGIVMMLLPVSGKKPVENEVKQVEKNTEDIENKLAELLEETQGAGKVKVMITYKNKGTLIMAENKSNDETKESSANRRATRTDIVLDGENMPVVVSEINPEIEGVLIVAQGGDNITVKNNLIRAVQALLGVESHKIEVLKMKTEVN